MAIGPPSAPTAGHISRKVSLLRYKGYAVKDVSTGARTGAHGVETGRLVVNMKKVVTLGVVALVLFFLIAQPTQAAHLVTNILNMLKQGAEALVTFVQSLF